MHSLRLCSIAALVAIGSTAWAGQPLNTEDAGVLGRSDCEFETSLRRQTERAADTANAMALKVGCGVGWRSQVALGLDAERSGGRTDRSMRLGGKTALNDAGSGQPAFALAWELAGARSAGGSHALEDTTAQAVTSLMLRPALQLDGRLYLNYSKAVQATWQEDRAANIRKADEVWNTLEHTAYAPPGR